MPGRRRCGSTKKQLGEKAKHYVCGRPRPLEDSPFSYLGALEALGLPSVVTLVYLR